MDKKFIGSFLAVSIIAIALLAINTALAKDYSVTAGNWKVDFKSNETLYTKVEYKAPARSGDVAFYMIWVNKDLGITPRTSSIMLFDYSPNSAPTNRAWMETYTSSLISGFNMTPSISEYPIDGREALIAEGWSNEFEKFTYGAMYPLDLTTDNTAQRFVGYGSNLDKNTTFEILDSIHVEYTESPQLIQPPVTTEANIPPTESNVHSYSYDFETLGLDFSTPLDNPIAGDDKYTSSIGIKFADGVYMTGEIKEVFSWEDSSSSTSAAEALWALPFYDDHSPLETSRLDNGDYVVYGRYLLGQSMSTKALRTLDLNSDGQIDYYVVWDGSGKIDQDLITYIAMHSIVRTLKPEWN